MKPRNIIAFVMFLALLTGCSSTGRFKDEREEVSLVSTRATATLFKAAVYKCTLSWSKAVKKPRVVLMADAETGLCKTVPVTE